ncbi:MAG: hypothetical protein EAZ46_11135 [Runella sp.]|nr:MAG: hypothetical protein EAZ46_11135 [Runella sp.]
MHKETVSISDQIILEDDEFTIEEKNKSEAFNLELRSSQDKTVIKDNTYGSTNNISTRLNPPNARSLVTVCKPLGHPLSKSNFTGYQNPKSNCKIVFLYTNSPTQPFATIINTDNSVELGKFSTVTEYSYPDGVKTDYYQLEMDFFVTDTVRLSRTRFKWID